MKEQLISFETAKLAKEKGFTLKNGLAYNNSGKLYSNYQLDYRGYSAPTQSLLQKWLRKKYNIHISIRYKDTYFRAYCEYIINNYTHTIWATNQSTYEKALECILIEALKLI